MQIKKALLVVCLSVGISSLAFSQTNEKQQETLMLPEKVYDFGKISQGRPVTHEFYFTNNSSDTLRLDNVQASCGCTTPVWKKDPVLPNNTSKITVGYNAAAEGPFEKTVTIFYNGNKTSAIKIKGEVTKAPVGPAPANSSIQLLKQ
jgi:hypothetical protein